jgi:hypothetical protein
MLTLNSGISNLALRRDVSAREIKASFLQR